MTPLRTRPDLVPFVRAAGRAGLGDGGVGADGSGKTVCAAVADLAWSLHTCCRRLSGTRSASGTPPVGPWSRRWIWPSPTASCCPSCLHPAKDLLERHAGTSSP
jgi:hypothetical protein